jgi:hypothetical protein
MEKYKDLLTVTDIYQLEDKLNKENIPLKQKKFFATLCCGTMTAGLVGSILFDYYKYNTLPKLENIFSNQSILSKIAIGCAIAGGIFTIGLQSKIYCNNNKMHNFTITKTVKKQHT